MSGGFFRGTSADQDTRFSNKQAKLLKSQKFAPELDHLVDVTKVKMDVIRPWIANRVTELLGFEDEVLINFIYGLLDGRDVNGKEVQISLTGFMEKNTGKFMKELWALLLSAQKNSSGVPQQFLDAKEEETRRKKVEADRIANEIEKKKEKEIKDLGQEKMNKMDGGIDNSKVKNAVLEPTSKHMLPISSNAHSKDDKGTEERNGSRGRNRVSRSPHAAVRSPSSPRGTPSRSISKSVSNSGSYLDERHRSKSVSGSPRPRQQSLSSERVHHSPKKLTRCRRHSPPESMSPSRRRSSYSRRRSTSVPRHKSPSPVRHRLHSPGRHRSVTPVRRRSPRRSPLSRRRSRSPGWRRSRSPGRKRSHSFGRRRSRSTGRCRSRSPARRRSRSPAHRRSRSPVRCRSRSPGRRRSRSPGRRRSRSPIRRRSRSLGRRSSRSPARYRSPSPLRRRSLSRAWHGSPPPLRRRSLTPRQRRSPSYKSPSPARRHRRSLTPRHNSPSPVRRRSPVPTRGRSRSPFRRRSPSSNGWSSSSPIRHKSLSPVHRKSPKHQRRSPVQSPQERIREKVEHDAVTRRGSDSLSHRTSTSVRSPQRDPKDQNYTRNKLPSVSASPEKSQSLSESPERKRKSSSSEDRRSPNSYDSPIRQTRKHPSPPSKPRQQKTREESPETSVKEKEYAREDGDRKLKSLEARSTQALMAVKQIDSPMNVNSKEEYISERSAVCQADEMLVHSDNKELRKGSQKMRSEKTPGRTSHHKALDHPKPPYKDSRSGERQQTSYSGEGYNANEKKNSHFKDGDHKSDDLPKSSVKVGLKNQSSPIDSDPEESGKHKSEGKERRKHKRSDRHEVASDEGSYGCQLDGRKEAKRRKKEEKRLQKEERRRKREERRRRREDRRAEKQKGKSRDAVTPPSDFDKNQSDADVSDREHASRREHHSSDSEEAESEQKKLEIELRKKALESLRAKKGMGH